ncbi:MAG TPA: CopG family transcriptional regulator [Veillonella dispar]|jgi:predicted DNA-binding protein|nr:CopG family transcriptional regulator [Veillonella dispar]
MKPKMGRPTISNPNSKNLTIRISEELSNQLEKYCEEKKTTKGEVVRLGIEMVIKK